MVGAVLAAITALPGSTPIVATAATAVVGSSSHALAYQHSSADKVAYLHDGSLLVGYFDGSQVVIKHVTNPSTAPVSTTAETIPFGSEVTLYTLPGAGSTEIWIQVGNELYGGTLREQIQYGTYNGLTFSFGAVHPIPGALTNGRQDPSVTWNGNSLIATWWDDTLGGNSDSVFMNWTHDKTGATGWISKSGTTASFLNSRNGTTGAPILAGTTKNGTIAAAAINATSVAYTATTGVPAVNDLFQFGTGGTAEVRQLLTVTPGVLPAYTLTFTPGLSFAHVSGGDLSANTVTQVTYNAATNGAPAVGETYIFGASPALAIPEVRTVSIVSGTGPYTLTVPALNSAHAAAEVDTVQNWTITYTAVTGGAPIVGDWYQFGNGTNAEYRQLTAVVGSSITFAGLVNAHITGEVDTQEAAIQLTAMGNTIDQVSIRHSAKLGATIAVYGARSHLYTRTLLDGATDPSLGNWTAESTIDGPDDSEFGFGGPQVVIDEATGNIHVFRAVTTNGGSSWSGVTYWLGTPDAAPMVSGTVSWNSRLVIDPSANTTSPPDIAGAIDSAGRVYVFWATSATGGQIKYVTLVRPYTSFSPAVTIATTGTNPRFPHVPAGAPLTGGVVPLVYQQTGAGSPYGIVLDTSVTTTSACSGTPLFTSYFNWFDKATAGMLADNIHLLNTGGSPSSGCVQLGAQSVPFSLAAGQETYVTFPAGTIGGPVVVTVTSGPAVLASQRVQYYSSFNEVWAMSAAQANTALYIPWFDRATPGMVGDNIHVLNINSTTASVTVSLPGAAPILFALPGGAETYVTFGPGHIGGPVTITSTLPVLAAQRVQYYQSFNEEVARPASDGQTTSYFNWFDRATAGMVGDNIHVLNPTASTANVTVRMLGASDIVFALPPGATTYVSFGAGHIGGPVTVISDQLVLASQRVQYFQSFNEVPQTAASQAMTTSYIMWFDRATAGMVGDNIHVLNTSGTTASVTVGMPGATNIVFALPSGAETYVTFGPGHLGGPVTITSTQPVLAAQRVQYFQSFNEVAAN
jgi:hypothetical protein